jgi:phospholipase C
MALSLEQVKERVQRIFVVMLENRSFDHVLGHLSLPEVQPPAFKSVAVNGLRAKTTVKHYSKIGAEVKTPAYRNAAGGTVYYPHHMRDFCPTDLPHARSEVRMQIGEGRMDGFVEAYLAAHHTAVLRPDPMGFLTAAEVPTSTFLATEFATGDRWHAPVPTDTQPNRLMAISGFTLTDKTKLLAPDQTTVFEWLTQRAVPWRVYSAGVSFYVLMKSLWPFVFSDRFRRFDRLLGDLRREGSIDFPKVVFVEPSYVSDPFHATVANDNHPPAVMAAGEAFLGAVYRTLTSARDVFGSALLVITYDEHGGFFDHEPPPAITTKAPPGHHWDNPPEFATLGVRVPALLVSSFIKPTTVFHHLCDHTSILELLGELYGTGEYSATVTGRRKSGQEPIASLATVLGEVLQLEARDLPVAPAVQFAGISTPIAPVSPRAIDESFARAAIELHDDPKYREDAVGRFPQLEQFLM